MNRQHPFFVPILLVLSMILLVGGCTEHAAISSVPYFSDDDLTPIWVADDAREKVALRKIDEFSFADQSDNRITNSLLAGRPYVASFFFVDCTNLCPTLKTRLSNVQNYFGENELSIVSHSVMPDEDTVERLQNYSIINQVNPNQWRLVTGEKEDIYQLATEGYGVVLERKTGVETGSEDFLHTEMFYLVDGRGYLRGTYNGTLELEVDRLIEDADMLLSESSNPAIM